MSGVAPQTVPPHRFDETRFADGSQRAEWSTLLSHINAYSEDQLASRRREIVRQFRANGLAYDPSSGLGSSDRPNALDLIPLVFDQDSWQSLATALQQRARLKQALYADIYGEQRLLKEGVLPAEMLYAHSGYMRDLVSLNAGPDLPTPLPLYSCDVRRTATGDWTVVSDTSQFPQRLGYALENRMVLSRVLPSASKVDSTIGISNRGAVGCECQPRRQGVESKSIYKSVQFGASGQRHRGVLHSNNPIAAPPRLILRELALHRSQRTSIQSQ